MPTNVAVLQSYLLEDLPKVSHHQWLEGKLLEMKAVLRKASVGPSNVDRLPSPIQTIPRCEKFDVTRYSVQFKCCGYDVDLLMTYDWDLVNYEGLYSQCEKVKSEQARQW